VIPERLIEDVRSGDRRALARAISIVEADPGTSRLDRNPTVPVIGVTGPPGVGKSTLVNALISEGRSRDRRIAVVAVDPSSPLTGGALLGDRIRMQEHVEDGSVYVRSMASRGHLGGLATATGQTVALVSQAGFDFVLVETVGVGQSEVEVMDTADLVVLVLAPGWGDQIQADKAGIVEIADIFVINKSDRSGVDALRRALAEVARSGDHQRPIVITNSVTGAGVADLFELIAGSPA
jgi:LAO/AO transport system kinase